MKPTFNQHVWDLIEKERNSTVVVDNLHAYAIIKDRLDVFWQIARQLDDEDDQMAVLGALIGIGSGAQLAAEGLGLVPEQLQGEVRETDAERRVDAAHKVFSQIIEIINTEKKQIRSLQKGQPRFAFEFDLDTLRNWQELAEGLAE